MKKFPGNRTIRFALSLAVFFSFIFLLAAHPAFALEKPRMPDQKNGPISGRWSGHWLSSAGAMDLSQAGSKVSGIYKREDGIVCKIEGRIDGELLVGLWQEEENKGKFRFVLAEDGQSFTGGYSYLDATDTDYDNWPNWSGSRPGILPTQPREVVIEQQQMQLMPDLAVVNVSVSPFGGGTTDDQILLMVEIKNNGFSDVEFKKSGVFWSASKGQDKLFDIGMKAGYVLKPGESYSASNFILHEQNSAPAGKYEISIVVDPEEKFPDSNRLNNDKTLNYEIKDPRGRPDLVVEKIEAQGKDYKPVGAIDTLSEVRLVVKVGNTGTVLAKFPAGSRLVGGPVLGLESKELTREKIIYPNSSIVEFIEVKNLFQGVNILSLVADPQNRVVETDETNNQNQIQLNVSEPKLPDWVVADYELKPPKPTAGDRVTLHVNLRNEGNTAAKLGGIPWKVLKPTGNPVSGGQLNNKLINPGAVVDAGTVELLKPGELKPGTYKFTIVANPWRDINRELLDTNNETSFTLNMPDGPTQLPDLVITSAFIEPTVATSQNDFRAVITVKNIGFQKAEFTYGGKYLIEGDHFEKHDSMFNSEFIEPGKSMTIRLFPKLPKSGAYTTVLKLDRANMVEEINEANNEYPLTFTVSEPAVTTGPKADIIIANIAIDPPNPTVKDLIRFHIDFKNQGDGVAIIPAGSMFWVGGPGGVEIDDFALEHTMVLKPGETKFFGSNLFNPGTKQPGTYKLALHLDPDNRCAESRDDNNEGSTTFSISQVTTPTPDLFISKAAQDMTKLDLMQVTVTNQGNGEARFKPNSEVITIYVGISTSSYNAQGNGTTIRPGESVTFPVQFFPMGEYHDAAVAVDPGNVVVESNEINNSKKVGYRPN